MNRIIILGSTGFLGKSLCKKLSDKKLNIKCMVHKKQKNLQKNEFLGDILDKKSLLKIVKDNDIIVNLVGQYSEDLPNFFDINIKGGLNLIEIAKIKKNIKIIFASSINVYGNNCKYPSKETDIPNPSTSYGIGKLLTEQLYEKYSKLYGLDVTILRFSNIYGVEKKSGIMTNILLSTKLNPVNLLHNGNQYRDFIYIDDAIVGLIQILKLKSKTFDIFNISSGEKISIKQIIKIIKKQSKKKIFFNLIKNIDDEKCIHANSLKAKKKLKFLPKTNIHEGLSILVKNS